VSNSAWSEPVRWDEACARSAGRRHFNAIRQAKARARQQAILRRLRELGDVTRRGVQAQLAREFGVATSVISTDFKRLFAQEHGRAGRARPVARRREVRMPEKLSLRLSRALHRDLRQVARRRRMTPSAFVRLAVQQVLGQSIPAGAPSTPLPDDAWELLLARCPADVQAAVRQAVAGTGLPLGDVLRALVVAACQPKPLPPLPHERARM
jgi:hypothetical protein